jgi:hypothetical protein
MELSLIVASPAARSMVVSDKQRGRNQVFVNVTTVDTFERPMREASIVGEEMQTWLRDVDGFEGLMILSREGTTLGLTFWESEDAADRSRTLRMQFLDRIVSVADVDVQGIDGYEVAFAELAPGLADAVRQGSG